jgi:hypothetical protein
MRTVLSNVAVASAVALVASCSLINSYDEVKPAVDETGGRTSSGGGSETGGTDASSGGSGGSSGGSGGSGGTEAGAGGASGSGGTQASGGAPATGGAAIEDSGADAFVPGGDGGAIVAFIAASSRLVVLNPADGALLSSEPMGNVRGIANDLDTDLWYIFEQTGTPVEPIKLHVRQLNVNSGRWHEVGTATGAPHPSSRPQVMNGRLAYLSTPTPAAPDAAAFTLTILNTEDPARVVPLGTPQRPLPAGLKQGVLAAPTPTLGGVINVGILAACNQPTDGGVPACDANLVKYSVVGTTVTEGLTKTVGRVLGSGNFVFTLDVRGPSAVVGVPADNPPVPQPSGCSQNTADQGSVFKLNMNSLANVGSPVAVPTNSERFQGAAYDTCFDSAFLTTLLADKAIWSVPLAGGPVDKQCQSAGGAGLILEPYTRTLIRQVQGGAAPEFYSISGTPSAPRITSKALPQLPRDFVPTIVAVREADRNRIPCPNP